ncbi:glycoside hydrolase family 3 N-terminal domain-containing protein [Mucilaginibacter sp. X4EP1]|uniref:glycoside hydrolase family 3 N-terminal domain-containing protein n=1 Tax=Mucilaginibacter sp. X4EP1 TaxID=2723092 RepID=UPI00216710DA|nr:glycoside hydrolase family 3 N-terminal domain-containing protein [Mucilaginibacter sp. X4EP1]MCS3815054.1 beta-glucosidase [Mucilaginibacter sp. X4EP1]
MYKFKLLLAACLCLFLNSVNAQSIYLDPTKPIDDRVKDLVSKLTLDEKVHQMMNSAPAIPRLNLPAYDWWNEALHGVARSGVATVFPQAIGLAATFDDQLALQESTAISDEARAMYNAASADDYHQRYGGLTFWTPNINIFRDPRWGRGQETYGEDPFLTSKMGVAFITGLQGTDPDHLKVAACAKHFAVHSGPERLRHTFNAQASPKDLYETYLPAFKALVGANVEAVMCAYNRTNNEPCCGSNLLLDTVLRDKWHFKGHVVSDCGAIADFYMGHHVVPGQAEAVALAVKHGVDLNCGDEYPALVDAVKRGLITEKEIDAALSTLLKTRFKLGMFDPKGNSPYDNIPTSVINNDAHRALAKQVALESIVLTKNNGVLPLRNDLAKYYVTGPNASNVDVLLGNYYGVNPQMTTILEGLASGISPASQMQYKAGILLDRPNANPIDWTTDDAKASDVTFLVMGISGMLEGEEGEAIASPNFGDRLDYNLPQNQIDFLKKLRNGNKHKIVAIVTGGSPMNLSEVQELADAVLLVWYPGEEGGHAIADIVFGKVSPSGRIPVTFPKSLDQLPPYEDYSMKGRTYRYMTAEPLYPFGFGLSYTTFSYTNLQLSAQKINKKVPLKADVTVTNTGKMASDEVVQLYITVPQTGDNPQYSLKGFKRIKLQPGEAQKVEFDITPEILQSIKDNGQSVELAGDYHIYIGGSVPSKRSEDLGMSKSAEAVLTVK